MRQYQFYPYTPAMWVQMYPDLRAARGMSLQQVLDRCVELRARWRERGIGARHFCNWCLDNPFATDEALICMVNRWRYERRNRAVHHTDSPRKACSHWGIRKKPRRKAPAPKPPQRWQDAPEPAVNIQPAKKKPVPQKERLAA